jgi:multiple sugar transport system substrate-binding protein
MKSKWFLVLTVGLAVILGLTMAMVGCKTTTTETTTAAETTAAETTAAETTAAAGGEIKIAWAQWAPADYLQKLSDGFTKETGVKVIVEQIPWETFVQKYNAEMIAQNDTWDIIVGDSQDVGAMATGGHYVDLTQWVKDNGVLESFTPASMTYYSEYPKGGGQYWGIPVEGDALGWAYRKDLFEDPANMEAFKAKYGYDLGVPKDWNALLDIAEFFHNPDKDFYGVAIYGDNGYDSMVMFAEQVIWAFGGDLGDYATNQVEGILNSQASVDGLEYYNKLFKFTPPAFNDAFFVKTNDAFVAGKVPMATNYFAFLPALANEATNPYAKDTGYFVCPPQEGRDGKTRQFSALGGQAASVVTYSKKQDLAFKWLEWFIKPETQLEWAKLGGYTCHTATLKTDEFLNATPYNPAFAKTMEIFKDFWAVPEYSELLTTMSTTLGPYVISNKGTAKEALDACTAEWTRIFKDAGYIK